MNIFFTILLSAFIVPTSLKTCHMTEPSGITDSRPVFSWINEAPKGGNNLSQSAYRIIVSSAGRKVWDSGKVSSDNSLAVPYEGPELESGTRYSWKVMTWSNDGTPSPWSACSSYLTGLMKGEWQARWIETRPEGTDFACGSPSPYFRRSFSLKGKPVAAVLHITAHGVYEASINGVKVGDAVLAPGWTSYDKRLQYQTYDVTEMLSSGNNDIQIALGCGWMLERKVNTTSPSYTPVRMGVLAQMQIRYSDGSTDTVCTDGSWTWTEGLIRFSSIYDGETVDLCGKYSEEKPVSLAAFGYDNLVSQGNEPVRVRKVISPRELIITPAGEKVLDFGQNLVGFEMIDYKGVPGQTIRISHAEVLDENGNFYTVNLRSAKALSTYICSGDRDRLSPTFSFYGFRYIKVEGMDTVNPEDFKAAVIYSDFDETGTFESSNPLVNQLFSNISWGLRGNFVDVPTDCPQRDERLGWTGDAEVFFRTATFHADVQSFFRKWLRDLSADQRPDGAVTDIVPFVDNLVGWGRTGWGDAATIIPWQHYMAYGDPSILADQYDSMKKWADYMLSQSVDGLWNVGWHYGDWVAYSVNDDTSGASAVTDRRLVQQCYMTNSLDIMSKTASVLGKEADAAYYADAARKGRAAFCREYVTPSGNIVCMSETAYTLALIFDMVPEDIRPSVAARLSAEVRSRGFITTGFLGTPHICRALSSNGYAEDAYMILLHEDYPGWLYAVKMGATTIWERWNSMLPDRSIPDNGMNSFNHYSFGAVGDWLYREAVGLREDAPGFKKIIVAPHIGGGFTQMSASCRTPYGVASASWDTQTRKIHVTIPVGTTATILVPVQDGSPEPHSVGSGSYTFDF